MKMNKILSSLLSVIIGVILFAPANSLASAFGVSPPWIENNNLKAGDNYTATINFSSSDLPEKMSVVTSVEGDAEILKWLTIQGEEVVMDKERSIVPFSVNINIPQTAKAGNYKGNIKVSLKSNSSSGIGGQVSVLLGGNIAVDLGVVDYDVTDYSIHKAYVEPIKEGESITLNLEIENAGNTLISDITTKAVISNKRTGEEVFSTTVSKLNKTLQPHTTSNVGFSIIASDLKEGEYWLDVDMLKDNKSDYKNRYYLKVEASDINNIVGTSVDVMPEGWVRPVAAPENINSEFGSQVSTSVTVRAPITNQLIVIIIGLLLVMIAVVIKFYIYLKKRM